MANKELAADWAADEPLLNLPDVTMRRDSSDPANASEHLPTPAVQLKDLARLDPLVDRYLGGAPVGVLKRKQRRHLVFHRQLARRT